MKRITYAMMSTLTALVLLFGYRTSTSSKAASSDVVAIGTAAPTSATPSSGASGSTASSTPTPSSTPSSSSAPTAAKTVTGTVAQTRWGPVQVRLTVQNGKITAVSVIQYPNNNGRDQEINATALPVLISETLKAQTAGIDMVSGATYTSQGYLTSLQSAIDQAGI